MRRAGTAIRWLLLSAVVGTSALGGWFAWSRGRPAADPLAHGRAAYDRGEWAAAADFARAPEGRQRRPGRTAADRAGFGAPGARRLRGVAVSTVRGLGTPGRGLLPGGSDPSAGGEAVVGQLGVGARRTLDPRHAETLFELTRAYLSSDRLDDATRAATELAGRPDWESRAEALLGTIQLERNDPDGAEIYWRRALDRPRPVVSAEGVPDPIVPRAEVARALLRAGRPDEARDQLRNVLAGSPDAEASFLLSRAELQRKDWSAARAAFEQSGSFREENPMMAEPARHVGASRCAGCHRAEFQAQQASRHARTFAQDFELGRVTLPSSPAPDPADASVSHSLRRDAEGRVHQQTRVAGRVLEAVVQYAFGSGDRGLTLVGRDPAGHAYELRLSEYPAAEDHSPGVKIAAHWDVTSGHPLGGAGPKAFLGLPLTEDEVRRCLICHVTDPKAILDGSGACASDRAISCERCHGPGGNHLLAVEGKLVGSDPAIARPTLASGADRAALLGLPQPPRASRIPR